jgi:aerobic-type carbon monoxide dehydrogenase small subunit (CoxS/CutS family)
MVTLNVNGEARTAEVPADMPLLWVLRDVLDLKGTKYGCGIGQCGACTVHVKGTPTRSCRTPVQRVQGSEITTIEGLSADGTHPVQRAWEAVDVPQCGYCQAGQIMSAAALLARNSNPSDADIDTAMNGNLCRCGTYLRIREAIHKAAAMPATDSNAANRNAKSDKN